MFLYRCGFNMILVYKTISSKPTVTIIHYFVYGRHVVLRPRVGVACGFNDSWNDDAFWGRSRREAVERVAAGRLGEGGAAAAPLVHRDARWRMLNYAAIKPSFLRPLMCASHSHFSLSRSLSLSAFLVSKIVSFYCWLTLPVVTDIELSTKRHNFTYLI